MIANPIAKTRRRLREAQYAVGPIKGLLLAPLWLIRRRYLVLELDIASAVADDQVLQGLSRRRLTGPDLETLTDVNPDVDLASALKWDKEGRECFVCSDGERIIHYRWYVTGSTSLPFLGATWHPEEGDYTVLGAFTDPGYRGRGVNTAVAQFGLAHAKDAGLRRALAFIADWNHPSLRTSERTGLRRTGSVTLWNFGVFRWHTTSGSARVTNGRLYVTRGSP